LNGKTGERRVLGVRVMRRQRQRLIGRGGWGFPHRHTRPVLLGKKPGANRLLVENLSHRGTLFVVRGALPGDVDRCWLIVDRCEQQTWTRRQQEFRPGKQECLHHWGRWALVRGCGERRVLGMSVRQRQRQRPLGPGGWGFPNRHTPAVLLGKKPGANRLQV
jgi:hypothetical protein